MLSSGTRDCLKRLTTFRAFFSGADNQYVVYNKQNDALTFWATLYYTHKTSYVYLTTPALEHSHVHLLIF